LNEEIIITPTVYQLLQDVAKYNVLAPVTDNTTADTVLPVVHNVNDQKIVTRDCDFHGVNKSISSHVVNTVADTENVSCANTSCCQ
jgi:hypothetical protein